MAQVVPLYAQLQERRINIVAVSFGTARWANAWLATTQVPFPIWLDIERQSYYSYSLGRSFWNSWGPRQLWFYLQAMRQGESLQPYRGDTQQMGGNLIVDRSGIVRYLYRSQSSTDRPSVAALLSELDKLP